MNINFTKLYDIAKVNGQSEAAEKYRALLSSMRGSSLKRYAVLGEPNSGKSTLINAFTGEKSAPVSLLSGKHDKVLVVDCKDKDYEFVEISSALYLGNDIKAYNNPLWNIDAALYIISALNPLTAGDIQALQSCISKGIPCVLVLNKFQMVDEDDKEFTLKSVKSQLYTTFGSDEITVFDKANSTQCVEKILKELTSSEDSLDIREYAVTIEFAKELNKCVSANYDKAKDAYESVKKPEGNSELEELYWEELAMEIDKHRIRLINETDTAIYNMYNTCNSILRKRISASQDPSLWWKNQLRREMDIESRKIAQNIERIVEDRTFEDKAWLSKNISDKFGINLKMEDINVSVNVGRAEPQNLNQRLNIAGANRKKAVGGLLASATVLAGGIILPMATIPTIIACGIGSIAVMGTGFWTYVESSNEKEEKMHILKAELDKYVSQCRDTTLESIRGYVKYFYENMIISAKDAQMLKMSQDSTPNEEERRAIENLAKIASEKKKIDEILGKMIISDEEDE